MLTQRGPSPSPSTLALAFAAAWESRSCGEGVGKDGKIKEVDGHNRNED